MSTHFVKERRARERPKGKDCMLASHPLERESQEWSVLERYLDVKVGLFQIHRCKLIPGQICVRICLIVRILKGCLMRV